MFSRHLGWYRGDFGANVCLEVVNGLWIAGVHFNFRKNLQKEIKFGDLCVHLMSSLLEVR